MSLLIKDAYINNEVQNLLIKNGRIEYIGKNTPSAQEEYDAKEQILIPGVIDPHTHIRDLKQSKKEDWLSASQAALKGGVVMVFDMPNTKPPTVDLSTLNAKRKVAQKALIHYKFNIAATASNYNKVKEILSTQPDDVAALKIFFAGSNDKEFLIDKELIKRYFELSLKYDLPVMIHTEWQPCIEKHQRKFSSPILFDHHKIRHRECAVKGTGIAAEIASEIGNKVVIAHTSVAEEIDIIKAYKKKANIFCEVTPHHLFLNKEILKKAGNFGKVNPPLRTKRDNEALWQGIMDGTVDYIGTDHAPHMLQEKLKNYPDAPSGFPGLETNLRLMLNEVYKGNLSLNRTVELTSTKAAQIFGLKMMGILKEGAVAALTLIDLNQSWEIKASDFKTKAKYSPYEGMKGHGDIIKTFI
jgi:dihydroorotase